MRKGAAVAAGAQDAFQDAIGSLADDFLFSMP